MANSTSTIILTKDDWTQVSDAGKSVLLTPTIPDAIFLIRYALTKPAQAVGIGHVFKKSSEESNVVIGGSALEAGWIKPTYPENTDISAEVIVLV